ncbi:hypothetical protein GFD17_02720 [Bifidobacterium sp. SMB2]|uniref:Type I restriction modification DNA specificity domain-containing protein n=1 Tax=Bifidobacterium saimiriisciurei TaxID=2661627 RepID=A0ABX0CB98_9BIFI|nr:MULTISPECIES: restriction endonuclease subunit S [Bifidobacterium]NEG95683.1 hypothetical protein [Bifidobacterium sp. SMB2]NEH11110.1 hypothetical protein [Bifidobacterium saimiriisciurei]
MSDLKTTPIAAKLRASILQQAIEGKLVPQDPNDEPASKLIERIRKERAELIKQKKAKTPKGGESIIWKDSNGSWWERRGKSEAVCIDDEIPFDIPENWTWARVCSLGTLERGAGIKRSEVVAEGEPCVRYGELYTTYRDEIVEPSSFTSETVYMAAHKLEHDELLITLTGENDIDIGKTVVNSFGRTVAYGGDLLALKNHLQNGHFLMRLFNSPYVGKQRTSASTGNTIVHLSAEKISRFLVPVPPLAEQSRIVKKIDAAMKLTDQLGILERERAML